MIFFGTRKKRNNNDDDNSNNNNNNNNNNNKAQGIRTYVFRVSACAVVQIPES